MTERFYALALYLVKGVGPIFYKKLVDYFKSPEEVFKVSVRDLTQIVPRNVAEAISHFNFEEAERQWEKAKNLGAQVIWYGDDHYPDALKNYDFSPPVLFVVGKEKYINFNAIAVVGTRKCTIYGKNVAYDFSFALAKSGFDIISGGARGIDTQAHKGAIDAGGNTFAILGTGLDIIYPPENRYIFEKIKERGALISEFPFGTPPLKENFPKRNRIIASLSRGILVVEAGTKSGALLTAQWGIETGKEIYVVPGPITSPTSKGTNELIKKGAKPVTSPADIIADYGFITPKQEKERITSMSEDETRIYNILDYVNPLHLDELCERLEIPVTDLLPKLLKMEMKGVITQLPGKFYVRSK